MCIMISVQIKWYGLKKWYAIPIAIGIAISGIFGSQIWFFVESGEWGGRSLYGAVVFAPLVFLPIAKILKEKYSYLMDFVSPGGCFTLAMVKLDCYKNYCCIGRVLYRTEDDVFVRFPSQIVEMVAFLIISAILLAMAHNPKFRGKIYPWSLVIYGATRFFLDFMRDARPSYPLGLTAGSFWSLCSCIIGAIVLIIIRIKEKPQKEAFPLGEGGTAEP